MARSPRCGRWTACLGGSSSKDGHPLLKQEYLSISSTDLGRTLRKLLAAFCTFQHQFSPDRNRNRRTHTAALSPPSWDVMHTAGRCSLKGFHRVNAGRYRPLVLHIHLPRVDTCPTLLPLHYVLQFPRRKISPGIKWSAHVLTHILKATWNWAFLSQNVSMWWTVEYFLSALYVPFLRHDGLAIGHWVWYIFHVLMLSTVEFVELFLITYNKVTSMWVSRVCILFSFVK